MVPSTVSDGRGSDERSNGPLDRREFLIGVGALSAVGLAGCSEMIGDAISEAFGDVSLINHAETEVHGSIEVTRPDGEATFSESFEVPTYADVETDTPATDATADPEDSYVVAFQDVWTGAGTYDVTVETDEGYDVDGVTSATESVTIDDPEAQILFVVLGDENRDEPIHFDLQPEDVATGTETG